MGEMKFCARFLAALPKWPARRCLSFFLAAPLFYPAYGQWAPKGTPLSFAEINSPYHEASPLPHPDGRSLYFSRVRHPGNAHGEEDAGDLWHLGRSSASAWGAPQPLIGAPNNPFENFPISFSQKGQVLYHVYQTADGSLKKRLAYSRWESEHSWSPPVFCPIPYFKNFSPHLSAWVSEDEKVMVLSLQSFHTYGHEDLYVSLKQDDGTWSPLENTGNEVNTSHQEITPFVARDGKTLFFSSNKLGGKGGFDVYRSKRMDGSWKMWSPPVNLGGAVNTQGSEHYFRVSPGGEQAYYTSVTNSYEHGDILQIALEAGSVEVPQLVREGPVFSHEKRELFVSLWDSESGERIRGKVRVFFLSPEKERVTLQVSHAFHGHLSFSGGLEKIVCQSPSYLYKTVGGRNEEGGRWYYQVFMRRIVEEKNLSFQHVFFEKGTTRIISDGASELLDLAYTLVENTEIRVFIEGHTDNQGDFNDNLRLSQQRVQTIIDYLVSQGVAAERLLGKGYGSTRPIASNDSEKGRKKNRRVSFILSRTDN